MNHIQAIKNDLKKHANIEKAKFLQNFFQTLPGKYGESDKFIGVTVPNQKLAARKYFKIISLIDVEKLLNETIHEYRLTAIFILVIKYEKSSTEEEKKSIVDLYIKNISQVNNWDLVDSSAHKILGPHLISNKKDLLYKFAKSSNIWKQRIAIIATFYFIRNNRYDDTLNIAKILLNHKHDLIHKAVGWMLREIGNRDFEVEFDFLKKYYTQMPRTMLRYAIEKFDEGLRKKFLEGKV